MRKILIVILTAIAFSGNAQSHYFPPLTGNTWDTISPSSLGWCQDKIDSLYSYLDQTHADAFIILKDGKIVLEKYFGDFTADSIHYWASAGKSLTATLTGIAQEKNLLNINNKVSDYLGTGWSQAPPEKENLITVRHLLTMTSGLDDTPLPPCDNEDSATSCLQYLTDAGTRWAYHTGAYKKLQQIISKTSSLNYNIATSNFIGSHIGMPGLWYDGVFYSRPRGMARFGLLALNKGIWNTDSLLHDASYFSAMTNTSQSFNQSYGYLWWLNGKGSFMSPGLQFVFNSNLIPNAPNDMFCALGKNDQKIYVVPSQNMVVIRVGESAYGVTFALSPFDDALWGKIDSLSIGCTYTFTGNGNWNIASNWSNHLMPPIVLNDGGKIIINPVQGGECILNIAQTVSLQSDLIISSGAKFRIMGNLTINDQ